MIKIQIIAIGKVKEDWMRQGIAEYQKRLGAYCRFEIIELEEYRLPDNPSEAEISWRSSFPPPPKKAAA